MSDAYRWRDAKDACERLTPAERWRLLLLTHLPLLWPAAIQRLEGLAGPAGVYRSLERLRTAGLVAAIQPAFEIGHAPRLYHLTDLGLAVVALDQRIDVTDLARRARLRQADLLALLPGLDQLVATYTLLAALADAQPGRPRLLAWERPWRCRFLPYTRKDPVTITLPAYAALAGYDSAPMRTLLLPDLGTVPLGNYRSLVGQLFQLRAVWGDLPALVIGTTQDGRAAAWRRLIAEAAQYRSDAPLASWVTTWAALGDGVDPVDLAAAHHTEPSADVRQSLGVRAATPVDLQRCIPQLVRQLESPGPTAEPRRARLGRLALTLTPSDRVLLDLIGRHPFLPRERLAAVFGWSGATVRRRRNRLIHLGLVRLLAEEEVGRLAALELPELTVDGLRVVAAQQGLTLGEAVRANGLAGGGPDAPLGTRPALVRRLAHTLETDAVFVALVVTARRRAAAGADDALESWQNATACAHGWVRPDGYGIYRYHGRRYGFFLEYDRGTMDGTDYCAKFGAYFDYLVSERWVRDYDGFPTILVVTRDGAAEELIAWGAWAAAVGRWGQLPILLTCRARIEDPRNRDELVGRIWRETRGGGERRRPWGWGDGPPSTVR
ncbi:MAG TPA: replication-relaxation family protein [Solirubrobacteraceae bacterium]|nr:replication-relaxation family protein [Solirubrobacteraceae bacterium]